MRWAVQQVLLKKYLRSLGITACLDDEYECFHCMRAALLGALPKNMVNEWLPVSDDTYGMRKLHILRTMVRLTECCAEQGGPADLYWLLLVRAMVLRPDCRFALSDDKPACSSLSTRMSGLDHERQFVARAARLEDSGRATREKLVNDLAQYCRALLSKHTPGTNCFAAVTDWGLVLEFKELEDAQEASKDFFTKVLKTITDTDPPVIRLIAATRLSLSSQDLVKFMAESTCTQAWTASEKHELRKCFSM